MQSFLISALLLLILIPFYSDTDDVPGGEKLTEAINAFYKSDWPTAQQQLDELDGKYPGDTTVHFFNAMIPFWKYFFAGNTQEHAQSFLERSEKAIEIAEKKLRTAPKDTSTVLLLSGLYGYRSLVAANEKEYRIAIRSGLTGFKYTRQLLSLDSDDPNAKIGRGVFNYMMGSVPREVRWATSFAGLSGDREMGLEQLQSAANSDSFVSTDALMILTYILYQDEEYQQAFDASARLIKRFPENVIFQFYHGKSAAKTGRSQLAIDSFRKVLELDNRELEVLSRDAKIKLEELLAMN